MGSVQLNLYRISPILAQTAAGAEAVKEEQKPVEATGSKGASNETPPVPAPEENPSGSPEKTETPAKENRVHLKMPQKLPDRFLPDRIYIYGGATLGVGPMKDAKIDRNNALVNAEAGSAPRYNLGIRFEGEGDLWGLLPQETTFTWAANIGYEEMTGVRRTFNTDYDWAIVNRHFSLRGDVGYYGINLFGWEAMKNANSVMDKDLLTRGNPDIKNAVHGRLTLGLPFMSGKVFWYLGGRALGMDENYYVTIPGYHFRGEAVMLTGLRVQSGGFDVLGEFGLGTEAEQQMLAAKGAPSFSLRALKQSRYRDMTEGKIALVTPEIIGGRVKLSLLADYLSYGNGEMTQASAEIRADLQKRPIAVGLKYEMNPVLYVGDNSVTSIYGRYGKDLALEIAVKQIGYPDKSTGWAGTAGITVALPVKGKSHGISDEGPTLVEKVLKGGRPWQ